MSRFAIALGSNLGDRSARILAALQALRLRPGIRGLKAAGFRETEPVGGPAQGKFLNTAATFQSEFSPRELLDKLQEIEKEQGRIAGPRWGPRTLDLDILLCDERCVRESGLEIPHPRMHERRFVLEPLAEIAPDWIHPQLGKSVAELLAELNSRTGTPSPC